MAILPDDGIGPRGGRGAALGVLAVLLPTAGLAPAGCGDGAPTAPSVVRIADVRFRGGVDVRESFPVQLGFRLTARNVGEGDAALVTDACGLGARAYRTRARDGEVAWDGRASGPCRAGVAPVTVPAGDSVLWTVDVSAADVLGNSLPNGRYHFTVSLGRVGVAGTTERREVEVRAGEARLALPR